MYTKEEVEQKIKELEQARLNLQASLYAHEGAILTWKEILDKLEGKTPASQLPVSSDK